VLGAVGVASDGELASGSDGAASELGQEVEADGVGVDLAATPSAFSFASGSTIR
jgi:hypothetical protein